MSTPESSDATSSVEEFFAPEDVVPSAEIGAGVPSAEIGAGVPSADVMVKVDELQARVTSLETRVEELAAPAAMTAPAEQPAAVTMGGKKKQRRGGKSQRTWKKTKGGRQSKKRR